jgi:hypothetical protein
MSSRDVIVVCFCLNRNAKENNSEVLFKPFIDSVGEMVLSVTYFSVY